MDKKKGKSSFAAQAQATLAGLTSPETLNVAIPRSNNVYTNQNQPSPSPRKSGGNKTAKNENTGTLLDSPGPGIISEGRNYSNLLQSTMNTIEDLQVVWMDSDEEHSNESKYSDTLDNNEDDDRERKYGNTNRNRSTKNNGGQPQYDDDDGDDDDQETQSSLQRIQQNHEDDEDERASPPTSEDDNNTYPPNSMDYTSPTTTASYRQVPYANNDTNNDNNGSRRRYQSSSSSSSSSSSLSPYRNVGPTTPAGGSITNNRRQNDRTPYDRWSPSEENNNDNDNDNEEEDSTDNEYTNDNHHLATIITQQQQQQSLLYSTTSSSSTDDDSKLNENNYTEENDDSHETDNARKMTKVPVNNNKIMLTKRSIARDESKVDIDNDNSTDNEEEERKSIEEAKNIRNGNANMEEDDNTYNYNNNNNNDDDDVPSSESESVAIHPSPDSKEIRSTDNDNDGFVPLPGSSISSTVSLKFSPPSNNNVRSLYGTPSTSAVPQTLSPSSSPASRVMLELEAAKKLLSDAHSRLQSSRESSNTISSPNRVINNNNNNTVSVPIKSSSNYRSTSPNPVVQTTTGSTSVSPQVIGLVRSLYDVESSLAEHARSLDNLRIINRSRLSSPSSSPPDAHRTLSTSNFGSNNSTMISSSSGPIIPSVTSSIINATVGRPENVYTNFDTNYIPTISPRDAALSSLLLSSGPSSYLLTSSPKGSLNTSTGGGKVPSPISTNQSISEHNRSMKENTPSLSSAVSSVRSPTNKQPAVFPLVSPGSTSAPQKDIWSDSTTKASGSSHAPVSPSRYTDESLYHASVSFRNHQQQVQNEAKYDISTSSPPAASVSFRAASPRVSSNIDTPSHYTTNTVAATLAAQAAQQATKTVLENSNYNPSVASPNPVYGSTSRTSSSPRTPNLQFSSSSNRKGVNPLFPSFASHRKQIKQQQYTNEYAVAAADAAFIAGLGIPVGTNPYLHPQYAYYRAGTVGGSTIPPAFLTTSSSTVPMPSRIPTPTTSAVAAAIDRFAYPHNLHTSSFTLNNNNEDGIPSRKSGNLRKIFDQVSYHKSLPLGNPTVPSNEETASTILTSLCHVIGVAPSQMGTQLLPRIQELCRIAVTSSSLDTFAVGVCDKLSQNLIGLLQQSNTATMENDNNNTSDQLPSTVPIGLQQAHALLDAALAELTSLRKLHYVLETRTQDHYYDNYIQDAIVTNNEYNGSSSPSNRHGNDQYSPRTERSVGGASTTYEKFTPAPLLSHKNRYLGSNGRY